MTFVVPARVHPGSLSDSHMYFILINTKCPFHVNTIRSRHLGMEFTAGRRDQVHSQVVKWSYDTSRVNFARLRYPRFSSGLKVLLLLLCLWLFWTVGDC